MEMTKDALGIKNYKTFSKVFNDLIDWKFILIHQRSKNQYSANVIALVKNTNANTKALTKASLKHIQKHIPKHLPKQVRGIVGIDKPNNQVTIEPNNQVTIEPNNNTVCEFSKSEVITVFTFSEFWELYDKKIGNKTNLSKKWDLIKEADRAKIKEHIPAYRMSQPDKQYRKDPQTYLNNESWNDEIIVKNGTNGTNKSISKEGTSWVELAGIVEAAFNS